MKEINLKLNDFNRILCFSGAGVSAESGLSTFRGKDGIWSKFKPEELASMKAFLSNPERVWEWYQYRRDVLAAAKPNPAHFALADWESIAENFTVATQNVDGLHQAAGSKHVLELHGNLSLNRCLECGLENMDIHLVFENKIPRCKCGGMLRPGVVWFGEYLPEQILADAFQAAEKCDLLLSVGTSSQVYPAASLPEIARDCGATVIEINVDETPLTKFAHHHLRGQAGQIIPELFAAFKNKHSITNGKISENAD